MNGTDAFLGGLASGDTAAPAPSAPPAHPEPPLKREFDSTDDFEHLDREGRRVEAGESPLHQHATRAATQSFLDTEREEMFGRPLTLPATVPAVPAAPAAPAAPVAPVAPAVPTADKLLDHLADQLADKFTDSESDADTAGESPLHRPQQSSPTPSPKPSAPTPEPAAPAAHDPTPVLTPASAAAPAPAPAPVPEVKPTPESIKPEAQSAPAQPITVPQPAAPLKPAPEPPREVPPQQQPQQTPASKAEPPRPTAHVIEAEVIFCQMGLVASLVYWRAPLQSGAALGAGLVLLVALACCSVVSVLAYASLVALSAAVAFRIYKNVLQAVQKTSEGHPFKWLLETDISVPAERAQSLAAAATAHLNAAVNELRRLFLVEDLVDSLKFGVLLWCLTYVGACFNGITLIILGWIALFTLPKAYEMNKAQVDANLELARAKINEITAKVRAAVPLGRKTESDKDK